MIELYMWGTGNGLRAAVALAESGLDHRVHKVDLTKGEQKKTEYLRINPAGQIPALVDSDGPGGKPLTLAQSGAIVLYAAEKSGKYLPKDPARRAIALQWFMQACSDAAGTSGTVFQAENVAPEKSTANIEFFKNRMITSLRNADRQLAGREYLADEFSVADIALYPVYALRKALADAAGGMENLKRWGEKMAARPGVQKGMTA
ncbi:MAG: glutathione S-transferase N-terminal domain-containing protein [Betaproteobacteria bacterium]|nr:glutathione S-transferase N-terminal domain-containing protein [Betaproteobacteria bacterium]